MTMPDEFMNDPAVMAAMRTLKQTLDAALTARGAQATTLVVLCRTDDWTSGGALLGCDCKDCVIGLAQIFGDCVGAKTSVMTLPKPHRAGPAKAVH